MKGLDHLRIEPPQPTADPRPLLPEDRHHREPARDRSGRGGLLVQVEERLAVDQAEDRGTEPRGLRRGGGRDLR